MLFLTVYLMFFFLQFVHFLMFQYATIILKYLKSDLKGYIPLRFPAKID